jgi:hypothetical protein
LALVGTRPRLAAVPALRRSLLIVAAIACLTFAGADGASAAGSDRYTPVVMRVMSAPQWFHGADGRYHLVYELELTNGFPVPIEVASLTVRDGRTHRAIAQLSGDALEGAMSPLVATQGPSATVAASGVSVVWLDVPFTRQRQLPPSVEHTITVTVPPGLPVEQTITDSGGRAPVRSRPPVTIDAPVRGAGWIAAGSCCDGPHRRALQPVNGHLVMGQRFAIDFNRADPAGRWVVGDPDVNASWVFYGDPVLAVADGTVVAAEDRWADQIPNNPREVRLPEADGNHVIIRFGRHRYAGYAHLVPGSVRVRVGQRVRAGQVIGRLGNSGSSSGPHLHFQVMTQPSLVDANGLAFEFRRFTLQGRIPPLSDELGARVNAGEAIPMDTSGAGPRRNELPLGRDVVAFP